jgi:transketolase
MTDFSSIASEVRRTVIELSYTAKDSHIGCALSSVDILVALYFGGMSIDPSDPKMLERDRFVLSKGHIAAAFYATLAARGFFERSALDGFATNGSHLASHVERNGVPGVEQNGGSGGHGLSLGCGMALAARANKNPHRTFVLMGDGELQEGSVWEAALFAASRSLGSLTLVIDRNEFQTWCKVEDVVALEPLDQKFRAFGWDVTVLDGHDIPALIAYFKETSDRPRVLIARTVKGRGVPFMEGSPDWHNGVLTDEQYTQAMQSLSSHA